MSGTFRDGPFAATTPDSGTCGNNWAIDLFNRQFVIFAETAAGTKVVENFKNAKFITLGNGETGSAQSPGACNDGSPSPGNGHKLREGVTGTFTGSFTIMVKPGVHYTPNQGCGSDEGGAGADTDDGCTTKHWIELAFPGTTYPGPDAPVTAYSLTYTAPSAPVNQRSWTNSDAGNTGDIFTS